jgi:hypothetical protein
MQRSATDGSRVSGGWGKRVVADSVRSGKLTGTRSVASLQAKAQEQITDERSRLAERGGKRKTPLTDRIKRAAGLSESERIENVPALESLRKVLFE